MLKRVRKKHPIWYCIGAELLFLLLMMVGAYASVFGTALAGIDLLLRDEYLFTIVQEMFGLAVVLVLLARTDRLKLLSRRGCGFLDGLLVGMYPLTLISYSAVVTLMFGLPGGPMKPVIQILSFLAAMLLVGVVEELLFRGVVAQTLLEHFGTSRAGVWKACLVSGLLFGAAHLTNLVGSAPLGVLMQCVFTASLGTMLAAIYFRTGNVWVPVFIHGYMDVASMLAGGLYGTETVAESVSAYDLSMLPSVLVYVLPLLFLLRKKKIGEVELYFGRDCVQTEE